MLWVFSNSVGNREYRFRRAIHQFEPAHTQAAGPQDQDDLLEGDAQLAGLDLDYSVFRFFCHVLISLHFGRIVRTSGFACGFLGN